MSITNPMTKGIYQGLKASVTSDGGLVPNIGGRVEFFAAGTTNAEAVYTDPGLTVPYPAPSNVVNLNSQGWAIIYLTAKNYKYVEYDSNGNPVFVQDNYVGGNGFGTGFAASIADLKTIDTNLNKYTYVAGYYAPGDGGGGFFYNATSSDPDDGGYVIKSTFDPSKDWFRIPDENGEVRAASFGYIPQNSGNQTAKLQAADAYAAGIVATLSIQAGSAATITAITFLAPYVRMESNAAFNAGSSQTLTFNGVVLAESSQTFGSNITAALSATQIAIPEWFGAKTSLSDNQTAFDSLWASGAGGFKINPGVWLVSASTPPVNKRILSFGEVKIGADTLIPIGEYYFNARNVAVDGPISSTGAGAGITTEGQVYAASLQIVNDALVGGTLAATTINATGDITSSAGNIQATTGIMSAGLSIAAGTNVIAGNAGAGGYLKGQAGTGAATFKAGGSIAGGTQSATITTAALSLTIPANTFVADNDKVIYKASGHYTDSANAWVIKIGANTLTLFFGHGVGTPGFWYFEVTYIKTASGTIKGIGFLQVQNPDASTSSRFVDTSSLTGQNFAADIALLLTGSAGTTTCDFAELTYQPAKP